MNTTKVSSMVEDRLLKLITLQENFNRQILNVLKLSTKKIYSVEEAALFLDLKPESLYQLRHHGKIKAQKKKGQKKIYFLKSDLEDYLLNEFHHEEVEFEAFENEILQKWNK